MSKIFEVPIFPLPNVVFFPKTLLPLHIFETRYRIMVQDALSGKNKIAMVLLKEGWEKNYFGCPEVFSIGCVGDIQFSELLADGKYNIMLYGLHRIKIIKFMQNEPYRVARVKSLHDAHFDLEHFNEKVEAENFTFLVRRYLKEMGIKNVEEYLRVKVQTHSLESIMNHVATFLDLTVYEKQELLEMDSLQMRYLKLRQHVENRLMALTVAKRVKFVPEDPRLN